MTSRKLLPLLILLAWFLPSSRAEACTIPVFRYALERWRADDYEAVIFHRGPAPDEIKALVKEIRQSANLDIVTVDLSGTVAEPMKKLWQAQTNPSLPWMVVRYPKGLGIETNVWAGALSREMVLSLSESPARREMARRLLQ